MPQSPQRPYVPHRTPTRGQPAFPPAEFALAKPFVPGADYIQPANLEAAPAAVAAAPIASIEEFLAAPRPSAPAVTAGIGADEEPAEEPEELPPLEHFLDPLPAIAEFSADSVADDVYASADDFLDEPADVTPRTAADSDWIETDWQRYDWQSVAALGDTERAQAEASNAWATTDWEVASPRRAEAPGKPPADAIATALDQIAERIRKGDLPLPGDGSVADPATIAATLAALLGVRR
jgi:hypothetical protein